MKTSVVILNWNGRKMMQQFLPSVCRDSISSNSEVVVADNGSTDDSLSFLSFNYPQVVQLNFDHNYGFAEGYNKVIKTLNSEYIVLLNSDVETTPGWLDSLISFMDSHLDVVACQPKIRAFYNKSFFEHAGACGGFIDKWAYPFCRGRVLNVVEEDEGQYDSVSDVFWATGACLVVRRNIFLENGGLDADFFAHMEEIDLCWRLRARNLRIVCVPQSVVFHVGGGTLNMNNPRKTFLNFRNNLLMIYKNEESLFKVFFVRFFMDYAAALSFLLKLDFRNFWAVPKARLAFWKMRPSYSAKRALNLSLTTNHSIAEILPCSLVFNFYAKQTKYFSCFKYFSHR